MERGEIARHARLYRRLDAVIARDQGRVGGIEPRAQAVLRHARRPARLQVRQPGPVSQLVAQRLCPEAPERVGEIRAHLSHAGQEVLDQRIVIRPLTTLTRHTVEIGKLDDTSVKVGMDRPDEIGQLSREFDRMLDKLAQSRAETVKTA